MKRKEAIQMLRLYEVNEIGEGELKTWYNGINKDMREAIDMAIEALQFAEHFDLLKEYQSLQEVVLCEDCRYANECNKRVQYTRNGQNTVTIGYSQIEWCSRGERREE